MKKGTVEKTIMDSGDNELKSILDRVFSALRELRIGFAADEFEIQRLIEEALVSHAILHKKEYKLAPRNRIDFLVEGGIGLEIKRGKPNRNLVIKQLERYSAFDDIKAIILVVDRNVNIPDAVLGKKCFLFGLNRLWGVALG